MFAGEADDTVRVAHTVRVRQMRRFGCALLTGCLLLAACSSGGPSSAPLTNESAQQQPDGEVAQSGEELDGAGRLSTRPVVAEAIPVGRRPSVQLPGLLDQSDEPIPPDDAVRTGTLDNGLTYYVRFNDNPGAKADLRLAIKAGSVDETDESTGVAHFVEHMLFNGTEAFPENELIDTLRSFGAAFGADVNAYTSFDETVYSLTVPNADESVELGMRVLEQWLSHATFAEDQVIAERGVVLDEWRVRTQTTRGRLSDIAQDLFLSNTPYEDRSPIGTDSSIENMGRAELVAYYDDWYRPTNASVIVVGDIDVDEVVDDIERLFGPAAPRTDNAPSRRDVSVDLDTEPAYALHSDPDQQTVDVEVTLPIPGEMGSGTVATRVGFIDTMILLSLVQRLELDISAGEATFDRISAGGNSFVSTLDAPALYSFTDADRVTETLQSLLDEYERANRFGFTDEETDVAREFLRSSLTSLFDGRESAQDAYYAGVYVEDFLRGAGYPSIDTLYKAGSSVLDGVTGEALNLRFRARWQNSAPHVIISTPVAVAGQMPTEDTILGMIAALPDRQIAPREEPRELPEALMERPVATLDGIEVLPIVDYQTAQFDPRTITLANGIRIIANSNRIVEGQVAVEAMSPGGLSLVADEDVIDGLFAVDVVTGGGIGDFNQAEMSQILAGSDVSLSARIDLYTEGLFGSSATSDLEVLFQLLNQYLVAPRFDPVALNQVRQSVGPIVDDPSTDPGTAGFDALLNARYPGEARYTVLPAPGEFATLDLEGVERVWRQRFGNVSDWVFVFAGDVDIDDVFELSAAYLGTIPMGDNPEAWLDVEDPPPPGVVRVSTRAGAGDTASLTMSFTAPIVDVDARLRANLDVAGEVFSARLTDVVREEFGDSYSPQPFTFIDTDPDPAMQTYVVVSGSPDRIDAIEALVTAELADLATNGPSEQEFFNAFAQVAESYGFVSNSEFLIELSRAAFHPELNIEDYIFQNNELASVTANSVSSFLATYVPVDQYIVSTVLPR
jgi:zinc protease